MDIVFDTNIIIDLHNIFLQVDYVPRDAQGAIVL